MGGVSLRVRETPWRRTAVLVSAAALLVPACVAVGVLLGSARGSTNDQQLVPGRLTSLSGNGTKACLTPDRGSTADTVCGVLVVPPGAPRPAQGDEVSVYLVATPDGTLLLVHSPGAPS
jgi:hypothetical protein